MNSPRRGFIGTGSRDGCGMIAPPLSDGSVLLFWDLGFDL
jgi:hypothetical protein